MYIFFFCLADVTFIYTQRQLKHQEIETNKKLDFPKLPTA